MVPNASSCPRAATPSNTWTTTVSQALVANGKKVITVDLNPLSRTARTSTITIVDNLVRCMPLLCDAVERGDSADYDHAAILEAAEAAIRKD